MSGAEVVGSRAGRTDKGSDTIFGAKGAKGANEAGRAKSSEGADEADGEK